MSEVREKNKPLPTIWNVPDGLWEKFAELIETHDPAPKRGRKRIDARKAFDGIIFRMRTGCQWNKLPKEFGDDASIHRTLQRWDALGLFDKLWATLLTLCQALDGVDWQWQSADGCLSKARGVTKKGPPTKPAARTPQIVVAQASRKACLLKETAGRWPSRLAGPTFQTRLSSNCPLTPLSWSGPNRAKTRRRTCVWTKATITHWATKRLATITIPGIFGVLAKKSSTVPARRSIRPVAGWSNAHLVGLLHAAQFWCAMTAKRAIIWRY